MNSFNENLMLGLNKILKNKKIEIVISLSVILVAFIGCSGTTIKYPEPAKDAGNEAFISKERMIKYGDKNYLADYGTLTVKENRDNPQSRLINIPVIRIHARTKNSNEPIFGLAGGPGQTNMKWSPIDSLLYDHDFVMVGYRGVDGSSVLDIPEVTEAFESGEGNDILSEESLKRIAQAWKTGTDRLISEGVDLNGYTIPETVYDMETARRIMKYNRINLMSESYGTRVAYIYSLMYPEKIHRSVMIGVNTPGHFIWNPRITDEQINYYSQLWAKDSVMSQKCPDLAATMKKVLNNMPSKWLLFSINPGKVKVTAFCMLFHRHTAALVFDAFVAAEQGDYSGLAMMSFLFNYTLPSMFIWGDFACKAISADLDFWNGHSTEMNSPYEILGSPMNDLFWKTFKYGHFQVNTIPKKLQTLKESDVETLLISGSVDFANPPKYAAELLTHLKKGKHILLSEFGHVGDLRYLRKGKTDRLITDYFNSGNIETPELEYVPMNFDVGWGLTGVTKVGLGTLTVLSLALITGLYFIIN